LIGCSAQIRRGRDGAGAVMLIGGEPGIGKSTLLTQLVVEVVGHQSWGQQPILYVSGEESPSQIALRIRRILKNEHLKVREADLNQKTALCD